MDENLKHQFDSLCTEFGMNATTVFNMFARTVVRERKIPFEIQASSQETTRESGINAFLALREEAGKTEYKIFPWKKSMRKSVKHVMGRVNDDLLCSH